MKKYNQKNISLNEQNNLNHNSNKNINRHISNPLNLNSNKTPNLDEIQRSKSDFINFINRTQRPEKECLDKIKTYKSLFEESKFEHLENLIEKDTKGDNIITFKFNFTFEIYSYGKNLFAYIIRCIDYSKDVESSSNSIDLKNNPEQAFQHQIQKSRLESFKKNHQITKSEKDYFTTNIINLYKLSIIDNSLKDLLIQNQKYINEKSKVYGHNHFNFQEDENSSQTSSAGYNRDLSKMNRIQEIRENAIKKATKFYTIFYIQIFPVIWLITSSIFIILYLISFNNIKNNLLSVSEYNTDYFQVQIKTTQILNLLIELYNMGQFYYFNNTYSVAFETYENITRNEYFEMRKNEGIILVSEILTTFQKIIHKNNYFFTGNHNFWKSINIDFYGSIFPYKDIESLPICLFSSLVNILSIFKSPYFSLNLSSDNYTDEIKYSFSYMKFAAIEESYNSVLPIFFSFNHKLLNIFIDYNDKQLKSLKLEIISFSVITFIILGMYTFAVFKTKNNMVNGLLKIRKLDQVQITDCIKRIVIFQNFYSFKFKHYLNSNKLDINIRKEEILNSRNIKLKSDINFSVINKLHSETPINNEQKTSITDFSSQSRKIKPLRILNVIYIHYISVSLIIGILIFLMYKFPLDFIKDNSNLIISHTYLLQTFLYTSSSLLDLNCKLDLCKTDNLYDTSIIIKSSLKNTLTQTLTSFPHFYDFYFNKYLSDICASIYEKNDEKYDICLSRSYMTMLNNTESLILLINREIELLTFDYGININKENFVPYELFASHFYKFIILYYRILLIPVIETMNKSIYSSTASKADDIYKYIMICSIILVIIFILNVSYIKLFFSQGLIKSLIVSRNFIFLIPTIHIFKTPDLENWLEQIDIK